jgi:hypothetical protein
MHHAVIDVKSKIVATEKTVIKREYPKARINPVFSIPEI